MDKSGSQYYERLDFNIASHSYYEFSKVSSSYVAMHWHNALEIIDVLDGSLTVETERQKLHLKAGDCILLDANVLHSTISLTGNTSILVQMPISGLKTFVPDAETRQFFWNPFTTNVEERKNIESIQRLLAELKQNEHTQLYGYPLRSSSILLEILFQICQNFSHPISQATVNRSLKNRKRIAQVISYTEEHYKEPISLADLAELLHLQVNYFCRFFKNATGVTYIQYLNDYRISKIYHDLITTDISLSNLLEIHGFTNEKLFRTMFRERFHTTPGEMRKVNRSSC